MRRSAGRAVALLVLVAGLLAAGATTALAHPLGNFSVNVHSALVLQSDGIGLTAVVDEAEIPTRQARGGLDTDGDGSFGRAELAAAAERRCPVLAEQLTVAIDGRRLDWDVASTDLVTQEGAAGLPTLRLTCEFATAADLRAPATVTFEDGAGDGRVGWHEITAVGDGVELVDPPVDAESLSNELRDYPDELLSSPLDQRSAVLDVRPGTGTEPGSDLASVLGGDGDGLFSSAVAAGDRLLQDTIGRDDLSPVVGTLAVLLAMLLGAGHAALPGHGKTVMAAYLAGRRGTRSDAVIVGATVTLTHTAGVLLLGLALSLGTAVAGEVVLDRLGLISGLLIAAIGVGLLRDALRGRPGGHGHTHGSDHGHGHGHGHGPGHTHAHSHPHGGGGHEHDHAHPPTAVATLTRSQDSTATTSDPRFSRRGLIGMAMAGGLVPSPSALVVLLGSVALGRTLLGVSLVFAYGIGMAATLTAVGLLLVRLRDRFDHVGEGRMGRTAARLGRALPALTAALVLVVGVGLAARSLLS